MFVMIDLDLAQKKSFCMPWTKKSDDLSSYVWDGKVYSSHKKVTAGSNAIGKDI